MIRKIVHIDEEKCNGCGLCTSACHEGAIEIIDGKAKLTRPDYCDGFGDCLPVCPAGAISFETGEVKSHSELMQWPTQIQLIPVMAPYFEGAKLLVAADCTAFAYASMHEDYIKGHVTVNGCPKLDDVDYSEKLKQIFTANDISEVVVVRMEVPCCGGLEVAVQKAIRESGKDIPCRVDVISIDGKRLK